MKGCPQDIIIKNNKGSIKYVYDAAGMKLEKIVKETGKPDKHTLYLFGIYEDDVLQFLPMEEGRIRPVRDANNAIASFTYDYFVKDHLGNVRMVLTEENKLDAYPAATLEGDLATSTDAVFIEKNYYDIKSACIVSKSEATGWTTNVSNNNGNPPYNNNPNSNTTANSEKIYKLNADNNKTGLGITLQVMAGDKISIYGKSYWFNNSGNYNQKFPLPVSAILDAFVGNPAIVGKGLTTSGISTPGLLGDLQTFSTRTDNVDAPWAYINWIFFDEQFKYVGGGFDRVKNGGGEKTHALIDLPSLTAPKNGYVFVYCSNESQHNVYFDNLQVFHNRGPILEETHYYPFGLTMAGISSKAMGGLINKKKFNGIEHTTELDLNQYDAFYRTFDPQIGRFCQIDPKIESAEAWSAYSGMLNNPILNADPLGDSSVPWPARVNNSYNPMGPLLHHGTSSVKVEQLRKNYDKEVAKLSPGDKKGRADLKEKTRSQTPEVFNSAVEKGRPMEGERAKVNDPNFKGNATKSNAEVNELAKTTGTIGKALLVVGVTQSVITIATSDQPIKETVTEAGGWGGPFMVVVKGQQ